VDRTDLARSITRERAERIARAHACPNCLEYSFRKVVVAPASQANREALHEVWHARKVCGICGYEHELGIDADGDVIYVT
jgi:hypothetical protein